MKGFENLVPNDTEEYVGDTSQLSLAQEKILRIKERSAQLSTEEFNSLIDHDFEETLRDIPPFGEEFDPDVEVHKIFKSSSKDHREAFHEFKDKFVRQRKAIAQCRTFIERMIAFDNDVPREKLLDILARFAVQYGFSKKQFEQFEAMLNKFYAMRSLMLREQISFPDDRALASNLTGIDFDSASPCRVEKGPISFDIYTDKVHASSILSKSKINVEPYNDSGFSSMKSLNEPILYNVINMSPDAPHMAYDPEGNLIRTHEREHQKNRLLRLMFRYRVESKFDEHIEDYGAVGDSASKREILELAFTDEMINAYERARDEIIAFLSIWKVDFFASHKQYLFFSGEVKAYDYLRAQREREEFKDDPLYQEIAKELLIDKYKTVLTESITAITSLINEGGYSNAQAIALLTDKPLPKWPRTVGYILEYDRSHPSPKNAP